MPSCLGLWLAKHFNVVQQHSSLQFSQKSKEQCVFYAVHFIQNWKSEIPGMEAFCTGTKACQKSSWPLLCSLSRISPKGHSSSPTETDHPENALWCSLYFCDHVNQEVSEEQLKAGSQSGWAGSSEIFFQNVCVSCTRRKLLMLP